MGFLPEFFALSFGLSPELFYEIARKLPKSSPAAAQTAGTVVLNDKARCTLHAARSVTAALHPRHLKHPFIYSAGSGEEGQVGVLLAVRINVPKGPDCSHEVPTRVQYLRPSAFRQMRRRAVGGVKITAVPRLSRELMPKMLSSLDDL